MTVMLYAIPILLLLIVLNWVYFRLHVARRVEIAGVVKVDEIARNKTARIQSLHRDLLRIRAAAISLSVVNFFCFILAGVLTKTIFAQVECATENPAVLFTLISGSIWGLCVVIMLLAEGFDALIISGIRIRWILIIAAPCIIVGRMAKFLGTIRILLALVLVAAILMLLFALLVDPCEPFARMMKVFIPENTATLIPSQTSQPTVEMHPSPTVSPTQPASLFPKSVWQLTFIDEFHGWILGEEDNHVVIGITRDGGRTWKMSEIPDTVYAEHWTHPPFMEEYPPRAVRRLKFISPEVGWAYGQSLL